MVARLHRTSMTDSAMTRRTRSSSQPTGKEASAKGAENATPLSTPICESDRPYSALSGSTTIEITMRSRLELR